MGFPDAPLAPSRARFARERSGDDRSVAAGSVAASVIALVVVAGLGSPAWSAGGPGPFAISEVDTDGGVASLVLDSADRPVIAYIAIDGLRLVRCNDVACEGGDESVVTVDATATGSPSPPSLALDSVGNAVIAYESNQQLRLARCADLACSAGGTSTHVVDAGGWFPSLALDDAGLPVIAYTDGSAGGVFGAHAGLKLARCNDPVCTGADESVVVVQDTGQLGWWPSLVLDTAGLPVIAHYNFGAPNASNGDLVLVRCNDPVCAGGDESIAALDADGESGRFPSLALDAAARPVVSFGSLISSTTRLVRCLDGVCSSDPPAVVVASGVGITGCCSQLMLDPHGRPVITFFAGDGLWLAICADAVCGSPGPAIVPLTSGAPVLDGRHASVLDSAGRLVVAYARAAEGAADMFGRLLLLRCENALCAQSDVTPTTSVGTTPADPVGMLPPTGARDAEIGRLALIVLLVGVMLVGVSRRRGAHPPPDRDATST